MASDPAQTSDSRAAAARDLPSVPLSGTRAQAIQRLQVGFFGLASMVLLVGLASVIKTNVQQNEAKVVPEAASTVAVEKAGGVASDPLADAGIVPELTAKEPPLVTPPPPPGSGDVPSPRP
jgi:hypothetical protein